MPTVLVADDQLATRTHIASRLLDAGFDVLEAADGEDAWEQFCKQEPDLIVTDLRMPRCDGMELLERVRVRSRVPVIILTAYGDIPTAVRAVKTGAEEFLSFDGLDVNQLVERVTALVQTLPERTGPAVLRERVVGSSAAMERTRERLAGLLAMRQPALIVGDVGTGRDHVARLLHELGPDADGSFDKRICAEQPEPAPGSGSVYLDGLTDLEPDLQRRWARAIEARDQTSGPRIIASIDEEPQGAETAGRLTPELAAVLTRFRVNLPRLSERLEDLPELCAHLIKQHAERLGRPVVELDAEALEVLSRHPWPENVRELDEVMEQLVAFSPGTRVDARQVSEVIRELREDVSDLRGRRDRQQRDELVQALRETGGNLSQAAELLGISRGALRHRARKHGLLPSGRSGAR
jgi:DNA-binding NtrC family response regulator